VNLSVKIVVAAIDNPAAKGRDPGTAGDEIAKQRRHESLIGLDAEHALRGVKPNVVRSIVGRDVVRVLCARSWRHACV
jgi:hypothetical protein